MHEMGVALNIVERVERYARRYGVQRVVKVTMSIGELSAVIPGYLQKCWGHATDNTILAGSELAFETVEGILICDRCHAEFRALEHEVDHMPTCPDCGSQSWKVKCGNELIIKEITVEEPSDGCV